MINKRMAIAGLERTVRNWDELPTKFQDYLRKGTEFDYTETRLSIYDTRKGKNRKIAVGAINCVGETQLEVVRCVINYGETVWDRQEPTGVPGNTAEITKNETIAAMNNALREKAKQHGIKEEEIRVAFKEVGFDVLDTIFNDDGEFVSTTYTGFALDYGKQQGGTDTMAVIEVCFAVMWEAKTAF